MNIPDEIKDDIIPGCPLSTRFAIEMYTHYIFEFQALDPDDPEYIQEVYLSWLEHRNEIEDLHCDLSDFERQLAFGLHAITWTLLSNHVNQSVSIYDIYAAMADFENMQNSIKAIHTNGFLDGCGDVL